MEPRTMTEDAPATHRERSVERRFRVPGFGPGMALGLLGGAGVILSMFLPWQEPSRHADDIPIAFLVDANTTDAHPTLWLLLIPLAALLVIGALIPRGALLRFLGGAGVLAVAGLFVFQLDRQGGDGVVDALDSGFYVAAIAGLLGMVGGLAPGGWSTRRQVDRYDTDEPDPDLWDRRRRR